MIQSYDNKNMKLQIKSFGLKGEEMRKKNRMKLKKAEEILAREKQRQRNVFLNIATALTLTTLVGLSVIALAPVRKDETVSPELESENR